jgi:hypothetical protein
VFATLEGTRPTHVAFAGGVRCNSNVLGRESVSTAGDEFCGQTYTALLLCKQDFAALCARRPRRSLLLLSDSYSRYSTKNKILQLYNVVGMSSSCCSSEVFLPNG